jgi:hypothetical protein
MVAPGKSPECPNADPEARHDYKTSFRSEMDLLKMLISNSEA